MKPSHISPSTLSLHTMLSCTLGVPYYSLSYKILCKNLMLFHSLKLFSDSLSPAGYSSPPLQGTQDSPRSGTTLTLGAHLLLYLGLYNLTILVNKGILDMLHAVSCFYDYAFICLSSKYIWRKVLF